MAKDKVQTSQNGLGHFLKHLFGNNLQTLSPQDVERIKGTMDDVSQRLQNEINKLLQEEPGKAEDLMQEIESKLGFGFSRIPNEKGGAMFVVSAPGGKTVGGAMTTREEGKTGEISGTKVDGDEFISKRDVLDTIKSFGKILGNENISKEIAEIIKDGNKELSSVVKICEDKHHDVSLPKALTTTGIALLIGASITASLFPSFNRFEKEGDDFDPTQIVQQINIDENDLAKENEKIITAIGDTAKLIKACKQEEGEERRLCGKGDLTEAERIENEEQFSNYLKARNDFDKRAQDLSDSFAKGEISEKDFFVANLQLSADAYRFASGQQGVYADANSSVANWIGEHIKLYEQNGWNTDAHKEQIKETEADKDKALLNVKEYSEKADSYDEILKTLEEHPDLTLEDIKMLCAISSQKATEQNSTQSASTIITDDDSQDLGQ